MNGGEKEMKVKKMALISVLGALAAMLMIFVHFPLPFMPPFMDFDLSGLPEMIGGFALGPVAAVLIIVIKLILKLCIVSTSTVFTGELSNFILSCVYVLPAVLIYQRKKTKQSAIIGMAVGTALCAITAILTNLYMIIPFYTNLMTGMTFQTVIDMCAALNPLITDAFTLALYGIVPFNLIKNGVISVLTIILYKKISTLIKRFM